MNVASSVLPIAAFGSPQPPPPPLPADPTFGLAVATVIARPGDGGAAAGGAVAGATIVPQAGPAWPVRLAPLVTNALPLPESLAEGPATPPDGERRSVAAAPLMAPAEPEPAMAPGRVRDAAALTARATALAGADAVPPALPEAEPTLRETTVGAARPAPVAVAAMSDRGRPAAADPEGLSLVTPKIAVVAQPSTGLPPKVDAGTRRAIAGDPSETVVEERSVAGTAPSAEPATPITSTPSIEPPAGRWADLPRVAVEALPDAPAARALGDPAPAPDLSVERDVTGDAVPRPRIAGPRIPLRDRAPTRRWTDTVPISSPVVAMRLADPSSVAGRPRQVAISSAARGTGPVDEDGRDGRSREADATLPASALGLVLPAIGSPLPAVPVAASVATSEQPAHAPSLSSGWAAIDTRQRPTSVLPPPGGVRPVAAMRLAEPSSAAEPPIPVVTVPAPPDTRPADAIEHDGRSPKIDPALPASPLDSVVPAVRSPSIAAPAVSAAASVQPAYDPLGPVVPRANDAQRPASLPQRRDIRPAPGGARPSDPIVPDPARDIVEPAVGRGNPSPEAAKPPAEASIAIRPERPTDPAASRIASTAATAETVEKPGVAMRETTGLAVTADPAADPAADPVDPATGDWPRSTDLVAPAATDAAPPSASTAGVTATHHRSLATAAAVDTIPPAEVFYTTDTRAVVPDRLPAPATVRAAAAVVPVAASVALRAGRLGRDLGVAIARHLGAGGSELRIRLEPAELGRIDVRMTFNEQGTLRAVVGTDSSAVLDMLRRDSVDLGRAITDAGVRADGQSFRFESNDRDPRSTGDGQPRGQRQPHDPERHRPKPESADQFRPYRWSGRLDVTA